MKWRRISGATKLLSRILKILNIPQNWCVGFESDYLRAFHKSWVGYLCTCAHADRASIGISGTGLTDCVQIWYVGWRSLSTWFPQVMSGVGHLCTSARAPPSPYLRIQVANCAKIWCMARGPIVTRFTRVGGGVTAHSHVRLQFRCLGNRWALTMKPHQKQTSLSRSFVHRQTWRLTGLYIFFIRHCKSHQSLASWCIWLGTSAANFFGTDYSPLCPTIILFVSTSLIFF